jgi:transposase InsO family protein
MIGLGKERHGLFYLQQSDSTSSVNSVCFNVSIKSVSDDIWHYRLGHLSLARLHLLHASFLEISVNTEHVCTVCQLAKQRRLPFAVSKSVSNFPFDLVHCDIWGPFYVPSTNGSKYFLTIVDTFSRFTWIFLMQTKSQARILVQNFFSYVETQFQYKIKVFRTDNGVEFSIPDFYASKGTTHQCSCVETPQQNAIVERKHQHLLNVALSLRFQAHLPLMFWGECVLTATHLINRIPTPNLSNKSPFEILFSKPPTYSHLRVFGSLCYASTLTRSRMKFDSRAKPCLFIGYPAGVKGHTLFDLHTKSVFISRDVIFHESIFPYASNLLHTNSDGCFVLPLPHSDSEFMNSESVSHSNFDSVSHSNSESAPNLESESDLVHDISSTQHPSDSVVPSIPIQKSSRIKRPPGYLQDFHCNIANSYHSNASIHSTSAVSSSNQYPLSSILTYDKLSNSHKHFSLSMSTNFEPKFYHQAVKYPHWRAAMQSEIEALEQNQTLGSC